MFKTVIRQSPLTTDAANHFFGERIFGDSWAGDYSFITTLRALLDPRMPEGARLTLAFRMSSYTASDVSGMKSKDICSVTVGNMNDASWRDTILVHELKSPKEEDNAAVMDLINEGFEKAYKGWKRVEKVSAFFKKVFNVSCFVNPTMKSVVLFTERMDARRQHYLQCGIPAFLPWYFDPKNGISEEEMALISSLREKTEDAYNLCVLKMAEKYDFRASQIRRLLRGFETRYEQIHCESMKLELQTIINNINDFNRRIGEYLSMQRDKENEILGIELKIANSSGDSELMEYFLCNKHLQLESVEGSTLTFVVKAPVEYFDEDMAKRIITNPDGYLYKLYGDTRRGGCITPEGMRKLMTEIFLKQRFQLNFCAAYSLRCEGNVSAMANYRFDAGCSEYMPNPHIDRYQCLGNNSRAINKCLQEHNYIGAVEQCISSCKSLNFGDSAVMNAFSDWIYGNNGSRNVRAIVLPDGRVVTPKEAVEFIESEERAAAETVATTEPTTDGAAE